VSDQDIEQKGWRMRVAVGQFKTIDEQDLAFASMLGVDGVSYNALDFDMRDNRWALGEPDYTFNEHHESYRYDELARLHEIVRRHRLRLESLENVPVRMMRQIKTAGPDRERELDAYCSTIEAMGRAGIPMLGYNFMLLQVHRSDWAAPARGGAHTTAFRKSELAGEPLAFGRRIGADEVWERYEYFIRRVLPVAESAGVTLALHPDDPPVPELYGVARIFSDFEGHRRAIEDIAPSPRHKLGFCCGTWAEKSVENMYAGLEHFGAAGRLGYIHFRNVRGTGADDFEETFIDEGEFDVVRTMRRLHALSFDGFLMDDHVPHMPGDTRWCHRGRAYATGYIRGLAKATAPA